MPADDELRKALADIRKECRIMSGDWDSRSSGPQALRKIERMAEAALATEPAEPKLAHQLWSGISAECAINDYLDDHLPEDSWDRIGWDHYDTSLELGGCHADLRLPPDVQSWLWDQGFSRCWLNHANATQTYYTPDSTEGHTYAQPKHSKERGQRQKPAEPTQEPNDCRSSFERLTQCDAYDTALWVRERWNFWQIAYAAGRASKEQS